MSYCNHRFSHPARTATSGSNRCRDRGKRGIGFETARRAAEEGAKLILTGRNAESLQRAACEVDALTTAAFDATDPALLAQFFRDLPAPVDHIMVTADRPYCGRWVFR